MKLGKMEGSPEEIRDFFQNNGLNIEDYLEKPEAPINFFWFILSTILIISSVVILTLVQPKSEVVQNLLFLLGCGGGLWLAVIVQIKFKNTWAAGFIAVGIVLLLLVALGMITPKELLENIKSLRK